MLLWLDGSDASTLYDATSGGSLVSENGAIARWEDKSGNANHATQATSGYRPLRVSGGVRFDGSDDRMGLASSLTATNYLFAAVVKKRASGNSMFTLANSSSTFPFSFVDFSDGNIYFTDGSTYYVTSGSGNNLNTALATHTANSLYINGSAVSTSSVSAGGTTLNTVGARPGTSNYANADFYELIFCPITWQRDGTASAVILEGYLAHKYSLEGNLPAGHPYKSAAPTTGAAAGMLYKPGMSGGFQ